MKYRLIVITHGGDPIPLNRTLQSFRANVLQAPVDAVLVADGRLAERRAPDVIRQHDWTRWMLNGSDDQQGFCRASARGWRAATDDAAPEDAQHDFVFWLEHDFIFTRGINLQPLADVLQAHPLLAQMQLMRDAVNEQEKEAGGLFESRAGQYHPRTFAGDGGPWLWQQHSAYFTTNPNLMRRSFMDWNPWPPHEEQCEGKFGIDLAKDGYSYGVWGDGTPWVSHFGIRSGTGY